MFRVHKIKANNITLAVLNKEVVSGFLNWVEKQRKCSSSTRNNRLAALRSFFKYLQYEDVKNIGQLQEMLSSLKIKKGEQPEVEWLTADELKLLFQQPDPTTRIGLRDAVLLELLYDTAARVQELIDLRPCDFRFDNKVTVRLFGKGSKERRIPLDGAKITEFSWSGTPSVDVSMKPTFEIDMESERKPHGAVIKWNIPHSSEFEGCKINVWRTNTGGGNKTKLAQLDYANQGVGSYEDTGIDGVYKYYVTLDATDSWYKREFKSEDVQLQTIESATITDFRISKGEYEGLVHLEWDVNYV